MTMMHHFNIYIYKLSLKISFAIIYNLIIIINKYNINSFLIIHHHRFDLYLLSLRSFMF